MALRDLLARFVVDVDGKALLDVNKKLDDAKEYANNTGQAMAQMGAVIVAAAVTAAAALAAMSAKLIGEAADLNDTATALGTTTQAIQQLGYAAVLSGVSQETLESSLYRLNRAMGKSAQGGGELAGAFKKLKIDPKNFTDSADLFEAVGISIGELKDPFQQSAIAAEFFGKQGGRLIPLFKEGQEGLDQLKGEAEDFGAVFSEAFVADAAEIDDNLDRLKFQFKGLAIELVEFFLPYIREATERLIDLGKAALAFVRSDNFRKALTAIAVVIGVAVLPAIASMVAALWAAVPAAIAAFAPFLLAAAIIGALVLIVDDLITFVEGGDSAFGRFLDTMFGAGTAKAVLEGVRDAFQWIKDKIYEALPVVAALYFWISEKLGEAWPIVKQAAEDFFRALGASIEFWGNKLGDWAFAIVNGLGGAWDAVKSAATGVLDWIGAKIDSVMARFQLAGAALSKLTQGDVSGALDAARSAISLSAPTEAVKSAAGLAGAGVQMTDQRSLQINVNGGGSPGQTAGAVRDAVQGVLVQDRQAVYDAVGTAVG